MSLFLYNVYGNNFVVKKIYIYKKRNYSALIQKVRPEVFHKTDVSKHFRSSRPFRLRSATLLKMRLRHRCFPMNFVKFLRMPYFTEQFRWLLLTFRKIHRKYRCWSLFSIKVFPVNFVKI